MTIYTVHIPPPAVDGSRDQHLNTVFIPETPAFWALVFPFFWLLWYRQWWAVLFYVLIFVAASLMMTTDTGILVALLTFIPGLFLFLEGNELRRKKLYRNGWSSAGLVEAQDLASAEYRYFHSVLDYDRKKLAAHPQQVQAKSNQAYIADPGIEMFGGV